MEAEVDSLTARQRAVLVLRVYDDLSEAQVAQVLDCAVGTVTPIQTATNRPGKPVQVGSDPVAIAITP